MRNQKKSVFAPLGAMLWANWITWLKSPRTILMVICIALSCYIGCANRVQRIALAGRSFGFFEGLSYTMLDGCGVTLLSILYLLTITELPMRTNFQYSMLSRTTRRQWTLSQILYGFAMSFFMLAFVVVTCGIILVCLGVPLRFSNQWTENALIQDGVIESLDALAPPYVLQHFSPWQALGLSCALLLLFWFSMTMVITYCSICKASTIGIACYMILLLANLIFLEEASYMLVILGNIKTPIHYATLINVLSSHPGEEDLALRFTFLGYFLILFLLLLAICPHSKRAELTFSAPAVF